MDKLDVCMCGTGEYTTGYVGGAQSRSDKRIGVVALVCFDLRRRGALGRLSMVGTNGTKFPAIREHLQRNIGRVYGLDVSCATFPADTVERDGNAYKAALDALPPGSAVIVFTPDDTHYAIAAYAIERGLHVLLTKPPVKTLEEHRRLAAAAKQRGVYVAVEYHKRFDPIYADARARMRALGDMGHFAAYMSQPKFQLETFRAWAGVSSDISYYLNSHHIDFHAWAMQGRSRPHRVTAVGARGVAERPPYNCAPGTEDTITLLVEWRSVEGGSVGTAVYTASWAAALSDVHSQQRFFYLGSRGEVTVDQAHRGYTVAEDDAGFKSVNPLYMSYMPVGGQFAGQHGYGYKSIEAFVECARAINAGAAKPEDFDESMPTLAATVATTAVLEAGRRSLDSSGAPHVLVYDAQGNVVDIVLAS